MTAPTPDADSAFFWEGLREHRLLVGHCEACGRDRFPPMPACPACAAPGGAVVERAPQGTVYSWVVVHRAMTPAFSGEVPYVVAVVELDDGVRLLGRLEGVLDTEPGAPRLDAGLAVDGCFVDHDGWTELRFRPAA